jgi:hypothetical protein
MTMWAGLRRPPLRLALVHTRVGCKQRHKRAARPRGSRMHARARSAACTQRNNHTPQQPPSPPPGRHARLRSRKDARVVKITRSAEQTKFKIRCARYLYTFAMTDKEKAKKLELSLPPGACRRSEGGGADSLAARVTLTPLPPTATHSLQG